MLRKEAILSSSTFCVERERLGSQKQREVGECGRFAGNAEIVEGSYKADKSDEIRRILEKIAMERLHQARGETAQNSGEEGGAVGGGDAGGGGGGGGRKAGEEVGGSRMRHSSVHQARSRQDYYSTECLMRELGRTGDSSSESSKEERRRVPLYRHHSAGKLGTTSPYTHQQVLS